jgi:hypothetical protein
LIWRRGFTLWHIILLVVNCLLVLAIVHIWWGENAVPVAVRPGKGPELPKAPLLRDRQPLSAFRVVAAKDLFSQERHAPTTAEPVKAEASLEGRELMGTMFIGSDWVALISSKVKGQRGTQVDVVHQGDEWEGYKIAGISCEGVVLKSKDGKKTNLNFPE